jgi:hypothetical protein
VITTLADALYVFKYWEIDMFRGYSEMNQRICQKPPGL